MAAATRSDTMRVPEGISRLLRDLIHNRTGLFFEDSRMGMLLEKLEPLAQSRGCHSFLEYYYTLKDDDHGEWDLAWDALSVQETYFWREAPQIHALTGVIIPAWLDRNATPFRIWSAACATGEEPYTIAIALAEAGLASHPIEIVASDASPAALAKAQAGLYRERSFRALSPGIREKYFQPVPQGWRLSREIRERVSFLRANLLDPAEIAPLARVQAVFCRNVFIYFSPHSIRLALAMMAVRMPPAGCLFVGASESLMRLTTDFELKEIGGALVYVRI